MLDSIKNQSNVTVNVKKKLGHCENFRTEQTREIHFDTIMSTFDETGQLIFEMRIV